MIERGFKDRKLNEEQLVADDPTKCQALGDDARRAGFPFRLHLSPPGGAICLVTCPSMAKRIQDRAEALAKRLAEAILGVELAKQSTGSSKTPDFRPARAEDGRHALEVKLLTVKESLALAARWDSITTFRPVSSFRFRWHLAVDAPTLDQRLPAHLPTTRKTQTLEDYAAGKPPIIIPNPDRVPGSFRLPNFQRLDRDAKRLLGALEAAGIMGTRGAYGVPEIMELVALLEGGMALAYYPSESEEPGYEVVMGSGFSATGTGEPLVARIAMYLDCPDSGNLRETLVEGVEPGECRHAFLVPDRTEPELRDVTWLPDSPPSTVFDLPPMIDRLWVGIEPDLVMWIDRGGERWQAQRIA